MVAGSEGQVTARCVTCGSELHPERALKYDYCTARECQQKNFKGLTMVAVGMNKAADELMILDDQTREDMASGKYRDQRRGSFGGPASGPREQPAPAGAARAPTAQVRPARPARLARRQVPRPVPRPWTRSQQKLALLYNAQGLRPDEIARQLGISSYLVTQIILSGKDRGRS
jgi:hypothetical protein